MKINQSRYFDGHGLATFCLAGLLLSGCASAPQAEDKKAKTAVSASGVVGETVAYLTPVPTPFRPWERPFALYPHLDAMEVGRDEDLRTVNPKPTFLQNVKSDITDWNTLGNSVKAKRTDNYFLTTNNGDATGLFAILDPQKKPLRQLACRLQGYEESPSGKYVLVKALEGRFVFEVATGKPITIGAPAGWLPQGWWNRDGEDVFYVEKREPFIGAPAAYYQSDIFARWKRDGRIGAATMGGKLLWDTECPCATMDDWASPSGIQRIFSGWGWGSRIIDAFGTKSVDWSETKRGEEHGPRKGLTDFGDAIYQDGSGSPVLYFPNGKRLTLDPLSGAMHGFEASEEGGQLVITFHSDGGKVMHRITRPD
jgi:hypothetical protein